MKREFSAGGIVYKKAQSEKRKPSSRAQVEGAQNTEILWLIRRPKGGKGYRGSLGWTFPKGWIENKLKAKSAKRKANERESPEESALREVAEEGGIKAKIIKKLPTLKVFFTDEDNQKVMKFITYFVMEWLEDLKEGFGWETEEIRWVSKDEAMGLLVYKNERELLKQAAEGLTGT